MKMKLGLLTLCLCFMTNISYAGNFLGYEWGIKKEVIVGNYEGQKLEFFSHNQLDEQANQNLLHRILCKLDKKGDNNLELVFLELDNKISNMNVKGLGYFFYKNVLVGCYTKGTGNYKVWNSFSEDISKGYPNNIVEEAVKDKNKFKVWRGNDTNVYALYSKETKDIMYIFVSSEVERKIALENRLKRLEN